MRRTGRTLFAAVLLAAPLTAQRPALVAGEALLLDARLGDVAQLSARALVQDGRVYVPLRDLAGLVGLAVRADRDQLRLATGRDGGEWRLDPHTGRLMRPHRADTLVAIRTDAQRRLLVSSDLLALLFGAGVRVDLTEATLRIDVAEWLPAVRAARRVRERVALGAADDAPPVPARLGGSARRLVLDYALHAASDTRRPPGADLGLTTGIAGGTAHLAFRGADQATQRTEGYWTWRRAGDGAVTRVRLGDGYGGGPLPVAQRGFLLTNVPHMRPLVVTRRPLAGELPPGWTIDAFRDGRLIGFDSVGGGGHYALALPLGAGDNPVDLVAYGPGGETRAIDRIYRVTPSLLPRGAVEYTLTGGACRAGTCRRAAAADLQVGATDRLTLRGGLAWRDGDRAAGLLPHAALTLQPTDAVTTDLEVIGRGALRAALHLGGSGGPEHHLQVTRYGDDAARLGLAADDALGRIRLESRQPLGRSPLAPSLELVVDHAATTTGREMQLRLGARFAAGGLVAMPYLRGFARHAGDRRAMRGWAGLEATALPGAGLTRLLGPLWIRSAVELDDGGRLAVGSLALARSIGRALRVEGGVDWRAEAGEPVLSLMLTSQLPSVRFMQRAETRPGSGYRVDRQVSGSVQWTPATGRLTFAADPGAERAGFRILAFLDRNADGERQPDEPALSGVRLIGAGRALHTDSLGMARLWGVAPFAPVQLALDTLSLGSPRWVPDFTELIAVPLPHQEPLLLAPVVEGTTITGRIPLAPGGRIRQGIPLLLRELRTGRIRRFETFVDGTFYLAAVTPGRYRIERDSAAAGGDAAVTPLELDVKPGGGVMRVALQMSAPGREAVAMSREP